MEELSISANLKEVVDDVIRRAYLAVEHGQSVNAYATPLKTLERLGIPPDTRSNLPGFKRNKVA